MIRLYSGTPYALSEHLDRLERSAAAIQLSFDREALEGEIAALLADHGSGEAQLRLIVTRGGRRIAATEPLPEHAPAVSLATVTYSPTVVLNGVKSLSYAANMQATRLAQEAGADEAVLVTPAGTVLEAPTSTLFWVSAEDGTLRTTELSAGVLQSITRERLIEELHVEAGSFKLDDLRGAREAFLASTVREVQSVSALDGRPYPAARGPAPRRRPPPSATSSRASSGAEPARSRRRPLWIASQPMDFDLSDEQRLITESAREFCDREVLPRVRDNDRAARFDIDLARKIGEVGYLGAPVAEEYGGRGLDYIGYGLIVEQIGRADSAARTVVSVQTSLVCGSIERWGSEEQKRACCRGSARERRSAASG